MGFLVGILECLERINWIYIDPYGNNCLGIRWFRISPVISERIIHENRDTTVLWMRTDTIYLFGKIQNLP